MANEVIKAKAKEAGIRLYRIAHELGMNDGNFSRKLRCELSDTDKQKIIGIIERLEEIDAENEI